jgi:hypothetical protein
VPTVLTFAMPAAGKFGHPLLKRSWDASGKPLGIAATNHHCPKCCTVSKVTETEGASPKI